ncbi:hypothetical protein EFT54_03980 [Lacticaseibacillus paracasei]|nr:hypothetical protein [Lacticaseibacillus paracasei]
MRYNCWVSVRQKKCNLARQQPAVTITRSSVQTPTHKDFGHNGQSTVITSKAAYTPMSLGLTPAQQ